MFKNLIYNGTEYEQYMISESGEIFNKKTQKICKSHVGKMGYVIISLSMGKRGKVKTIRLHKALAETFIPNPNNCTVVHHIDGDKTNYNLDNLKWVTSSENTVFHLQELSKTEDLFNNRKLKKDDVEFIRNNYPRLSLRTLAKKFNVSKTTILKVVKNRLYVNGVW